jgi:dihydroorotate dehydrogenase (NAD+) catalytic subunit
VQIGTASFSRPDTVFRIVEELPAVAEKYGVSDWESFRGSLLEG